MNTTHQQSLIQRGSAFALAAIVTLALLGGIDALATQDAGVDARLAQQVSTLTASS